MRIGRTIIDLDSLTTEDLTMVINEALRIRHRKKEAESLKNRMRQLLAEAKEHDFIFVADTKRVIPEDGIDLFDES